MSTPSQREIVYIGEILSKYGNKIDLTTLNMLQHRISGWGYMGFTSYCSSQFRWLRKQFNHSFLYCAIVMPYYAVRFLFR